ncbi:MAG: galactokinase, partial [Firmicutes bacterium]|nr:galactokinase [Bacillota bacterium]
SGLSSSAALALSLLASAEEEADVHGTVEQLPLLARRLENDYLHVQSGIMDQLAIVYGQKGCALWVDAEKKTAQAIPFFYQQDGWRIWIIDTRQPRSLAKSAYAVRVNEAHAAAQALHVPNLRRVQEDQLAALPVELARRARHILRENRRVEAVVAAAQQHQWQKVAELFQESHQSLAQDYAVTTPVLDETVQACRDIGVGARMTGAGFGGSIVVIGPIAAEKDLQIIVQQLYHRRRWEAAQVIPVAEPAAGLHRI